MYDIDISILSACHYKIKYKKRPLYAITRLSGSQNESEIATWVKRQNGAGATAQWVRSLLCRHGDLSSDPYHPCEKQV